MGHQLWTGLDRVGAHVSAQDGDTRHSQLSESQLHLQTSLFSRAWCHVEQAFYLARFKAILPFQLSITCL